MTCRLAKTISGETISTYFGFQRIKSKESELFIYTQYHKDTMSRSPNARKLRSVYGRRVQGYKERRVIFKRTVLNSFWRLNTEARKIKRLLQERLFFTHVRSYLNESIAPSVAIQLGKQWPEAISIQQRKVSRSHGSELLRTGGVTSQGAFTVAIRSVVMFTATESEFTKHPSVFADVTKFPEIKDVMENRTRLGSTRFAS